MVFAIFFFITMILGISFAATKKNLHPFEILFMWMVIIVIHHNFITIATNNLKLYDFSDRLPNYWVLVFERVVLVPLLMLYYFDRMVARRPYQKWLWLPIGILLLSGLEYFTVKMKLFTYVRWVWWWSLLEWLVLFLIVHFSWLWYHALLTKEMK